MGKVGTSLEIVLGKVLKTLRSDLQMSQEILAIESNLDRSFISMIERGLRMPTVDTLFKIAGPLKTTPSHILELVQKEYEN